MTSSKPRTSVATAVRPAPRVEPVTQPTTAIPAPKSYSELLIEEDGVIDRLRSLQKEQNNRANDLRREAYSSLLSDRECDKAFEQSLNSDEELGEIRQRIREAGQDLDDVHKQVESARAIAKTEWFNGKAAKLREPYIGKMVTFGTSFRDINNLENPFALDPTYDWKHKRGNKHFEQQQWKYGTVTKSGKVIKARTKVGLLSLLKTINQTEQLISEVDLDPKWTHIYEQRGNTRRMGGCAHVTQGGFMEAITGQKKEVLPVVVALSSDQDEVDRTYTTIHEIAHINGRDDNPPHGTTYCRRFGEYLGLYLTQENAAFKQEIKKEIEEDTYSHPVIDERIYSGEYTRTTSGDGTVKLAFGERT